MYKRGSGKSGARCKKPAFASAILGISKPSLRRLARRGGVKRISGLTYEEVRDALKCFLQRTIRDATLYALCADRKTITANDVINALKRQGRNLYGFGQ